uniref:Reverse transcriptase zinc-binding domain-containing protein n=1 Tax=Rhizophora mucronata TaxID=61149 RepID=A0A2P2IQZ4_RHIMU
MEANQIEWFELVWGSCQFPKHSFIAWLAILNRLSTKDRLLRKGTTTDFAHSLCGPAEESGNRLFL